MYLMAFSTYWLEEEAVWGLPALVSRIKAAIKQVQIPHHGCLVLWLQPAGGINVGQRCPHPVRVAGVVHGGIVRKGQLRGQLVGTGTVKAHPAVLPRLLLVGGVADQLAGAGKEQVALAYLPSAAAHLEDALAGYHQMDQVVVTDAGVPMSGPERTAPSPQLKMDNSMLLV